MIVVGRRLEQSPGQDGPEGAPVVDDDQDEGGVVAPLVDDAIPTDSQFEVPVDTELLEFRRYGAVPRLVGQHATRSRSSASERDQAAESKRPMT